VDLPVIDPRLITGLNLRYLLTLHLFETGRVMSVPELLDIVESEGFVLRGRGAKTVSDALRWEMGHGRVVRHGRGRYGPGSMPRQTRSRIRQRVRTLRQQVVAARRDIEEVGTAGGGRP
jgi:hypothetical protein